MNEKLRLYVEELFKNAPKLKETVELKEEILQNTIDRYNDLLAEGKSPEAAYNISVAGIGDVGHLIDSLTAPIASSGYTKEEISKNERKRNLLLVISVMLYILSIVPTIVLEETDIADTVGVALMFVMIAIATGILIYRSGIKLDYNKNTGTVVEDFKEWKREVKQKNSVLAAVIGAVWAITVIVYIVVSFLTAAWYITWIIFLIGGAITGIVNAVFDLTR